jgi:co-chaperonin GroES (HSP10)
MELEQATESGIILQNPQGLNPRAQIISIGPKVNCGLAVGNQLMVDWRRTDPVKHEDQTYYLVDQQDVWAVFE